MTNYDVVMLFTIIMLYILEMVNVWNGVYQRNKIRDNIGQIENIIIYRDKEIELLRKEIIKLKEVLNNDK